MQEIRLGEPIGEYEITRSSDGESVEKGLILDAEVVDGARSTVGRTVKYAAGFDTAFPKKSKNAPVDPSVN